MPGHDLTSDRLAMRALMQRIARETRCGHGEPVPVILSTGERVAWLCPECDAQLPPDYWITMMERELEEETASGPR